jgi:hypothetical protein
MEEKWFYIAVIAGGEVGAGVELSFPPVGRKRVAPAWTARAVTWRTAAATPPRQ